MNLTALRETLDHDGPFASVHLDASHDTEDAAKLDELRWRAVRAELAERGAPAATIAALESADAPPPAGPAGRLLVAAADTVLVDEYLPNPPARPRVRLSPLPYVLPLAAWDQQPVPHVVVVLDQVGADLRAVDATGAVHTEDVAGRAHPVHKVRGGGWSHRAVQRHTEETVRRNIADVAQEAAELVRRVGARLLVLAGDGPNRAQLRQALPEPCARIATDVEHGGPANATVEQAVEALLADYRQAERDRLLARFRAARGHDIAVPGLRPTTAALRAGNVETLLVDAPALADSTVWTGSDPGMVAVDRDELHRVGVSDRTEARADEALPAAAASAGSDVLAATGDQPEFDLPNGVGAILRHT